MSVPVSDWTRRTYDAVDRRDADGFVRSLTDDVWVRFGNAPPTIGREATRVAIAQFFTAMRTVRHTFLGEWRTETTDGPALLLEGEVTYTRHDGGVVTVPALTSYRLRREGDGEERAYWMQVYVDLAPLFAPPAASRTASDDADAAVQEADEESFPASDPPAWGPTHAG